MKKLIVTAIMFNDKANDN